MTTESSLGSIDPAVLVRRIFDGFFEDRSRVFAPSADLADRGWTPPLEVSVRDHTLTIRVDLPGITPEDVSITVAEEGLAIEGDRKSEVNEETDDWFVSERKCGKFRRVVALPDGVNAADVKARFDDGVLEVTVPMPRVVAPTRPHKVPIAAAAGRKTVCAA